ncbi:MAG: YtxH domain-containing protein [Acidobacteria bacterium]|nr:YtxH domain-containing protein [Acidobacteriota bacterium]
MAQGSNSKLNAAVLLLSGAALGATLALLFAPQSGKKTRRDLQRTGRQALDRAEAFQQELRDHVDDLVESIVETSSEGLEKGRALTEKVVAALESGRRTLENGKNRVQQLFH